MTDNAKSRLIEEYEGKTPKSHDYYSQFCLHLPGGETRSVTHYNPYPVVLTEGSGAVVRDVDDNEYLDVLNNYTSLVHGHGFAPITESVQAVLSRGTVFPAPHPALLQMAEILTERYPAVQRVRFTNSGTEATLLALRIVRAATGRRRVVMFEGGYHGSISEFIDGDRQTIRVRYNDLDQAIAMIDTTVAAVFAEPFLGSGGVIPAVPGFLRAVEESAHRVGSLLVLDEVQSLRNSLHGMHFSLGLQPDLLTMGKVIGGGLPVGAVGGSASLLELTNVQKGGRISHSGTFNGNVATMAAGAASIRALDEPTISWLNERAESLAPMIEAAAHRQGVPASVTRAGSILHVHLVDHPPTCAEDDRTSPPEWASVLHLALLLEGVYAAPRGMLNLSSALDDRQLARVVVAYEHAFERIKDVVCTGKTYESDREMTP